MCCVYCAISIDPIPVCWLPSSHLALAVRKSRADDAPAHSSVEVGGGRPPQRPKGDGELRADRQLISRLGVVGLGSLTVAEDATGRVDSNCLTCVELAKASSAAALRTITTSISWMGAHVVFDGG